MNTELNWKWRVLLDWGFNSVVLPLSRRDDLDKRLWRGPNDVVIKNAAPLPSLSDPSREYDQVELEFLILWKQPAPDGSPVYVANMCRYVSQKVVSKYNLDLDRMKEILSKYNLDLSNALDDSTKDE